jgi:hyaluronan synthase
MEIMNFINNKKISLFIIFSLFVWAAWIIKYYFSRKYKPYDSNYDGKVSIVIPTLREELDVFENCLKSVRAQSKKSELIVVLDGAEKSLEDMANKYADKVISHKWRGKRPCIVDGFKYASGDILILMDSDSYYESNDGIKELIKPFADKMVGGVTSKQKIFNPHGNIIRRFAAWMEDVRFSIGHPAQSYFGGVGCLPGRAIAFRKEYIIKHLNLFLDDKFMGEKSIISDDRALTGYIMRDGHKTVYQSTSVVYTDCPNNWKKFIKQQLRWARGSQRETLHNIGWLVKKNKFTAGCFIADILIPLMFFAVIFEMIIRNLYGVDNLYNITLGMALIAAIIGMSFSVGARQAIPVDYTWKEFMYLPLYCLFLTFIQTPIRVYGLMTCYDQGWMTR